MTFVESLHEQLESDLMLPDIYHNVFLTRNEILLCPEGKSNSASNTSLKNSSPVTCSLTPGRFLMPHYASRGSLAQCLVIWGALYSS